ncbi:hypothetical protein F5887DRAFT_1075734 [Amanita rubescens]|nr:hypothetical protein F5887DRAFT_1075734 [Amanita rubescens]
MTNIIGCIFVPFADNSTSHGINIWVKLYVEIVFNMLSPIEALIIGITLQALLTGVYFASFLLCLRWLIFSDDGGTLRKPIHRPFLTITLILFAFSVTTLGLCLRRALYVTQSATAYIKIINMFIEMLTSIITDGVLIFRCWTVYNRSWRIAILLLLLWMYNISSLITLTYWSIITAITGNEPTSPYDCNAMPGSYYAATIIINIFATSAIITFRIWKNSLSRRFARFVIRVIAESGLLYTLTSIANFCTVIINSYNGVFITSAINNRTAGIAFNLILIRVAQNRANSELEPPTFIGDSTIERAIPAAPRHHSEMVALSREEL